MNMRNLLTILFSLLAAVTVAAQHRISVDAPGSVGLDDYFTVKYTVNTSEVESFTPPALHDFELLSGPNKSVSSSYQIVNRKASSSSSCTYTLVLSPKKKGSFTLSGAAITVGGKRMPARNVTIKVTDDASAAGAGGHGTGGGSSAHEDNTPGRPDMQRAGTRITASDLYVTVTPSRTHIYEQEAILLTYKFYAKAGVALANIGLSKKPDFKGLVSQDLPIKEVQQQIERVGGQTYRTGVVMQYVIFPQNKGELKIPGVVFDCTVAQYNHTIDPIDAFFNGGGSVGVTVKRATPELTLHVNALPEPRPAAFSGGVGKFSIKGELLTPHPKTNDICTYRLTVSGEGNLKLLLAPHWQLPKDFDGYDPKTTDRTKVTSSGVTGEMVYDYTFVPHNVGNYSLPPIEFVCFDTSSGQYKTLHTAPIELHIAQGKRSEADVQREMELRNSDIRSQHPSPARGTGYEAFVRWGSSGFWFLQAEIIALFAFVCFCLRRYISRRSDTVAQKRRKAGKLAGKRLKLARKQLESGNTKAFYAEIYNALVGFVADKHNRKPAELTKESIEALLTADYPQKDVAERFVRLLETCEFARYAPATDAEGLEKVYDDAAVALDDAE